MLNIDSLGKAAARREERAAARKGRVPNETNVHVHLSKSLLGIPDPSNTTKKCRRNVSIEPEDDIDSFDETPDTISITTILTDLHSRMPDNNYLKYEANLRNQGIAYACSVLDFERDFFVTEIGMPKGIVGEFQRFTRRAVKGKGHRKRARTVEKENVDSFVDLIEDYD